jgi:hypothetical protein
MNLGASLPRTLKWGKPLIGDTLRYTKPQLQSSTPFFYDRCNLFASIVQLAGSLSLYELASRLLAICQVRKPFILQSRSKTTEFDTYIHISSQTAPSSNSLDSYYYKRTQHTTDSYSNSFRTTEHMLLACLLESDLPFRSDHRSEDDPRLHATFPKTSK